MFESGSRAIRAKKQSEWFDAIMLRDETIELWQRRSATVQPKLSALRRSLAKAATLVMATLVGRLAVGINFRSRGLGGKLLMDTLYPSLHSSGQVASKAVIVDAKDAEAFAFYLSHVRFHRASEGRAETPVVDGYN